MLVLCSHTPYIYMGTLVTGVKNDNITDKD